MSRSIIRLLRIVLVSIAMAGAACGAAPKLDEATVKATIEKNAGSSVHPRFFWRSVEIASPRKASGGEIRAAGLPPDATIWPVRVDFTKQIGDGARDTKWNYYFFQDDFGGWAYQSNATTGNLESDLYYKKP